MSDCENYIGQLRAALLVVLFCANAEFNAGTGKHFAQHQERFFDRASLTPRELSVLRWLSLGHRIAEVGEDLGLGEETVRSHIKKAQVKLRDTKLNTRCARKPYGCG